MAIFLTDEETKLINQLPFCLAMKIYKLVVKNNERQQALMYVVDILARQTAHAKEKNNRSADSSEWEPSCYLINKLIEGGSDE